ncbi:MAG: methyl-accepting chemotaxis protein [Aestuariibacter sp.]
MRPGTISSLISYPVVSAIALLTVLNFYSLFQLAGNSNDVKRIESQIITSEQLIGDTLQTFKTQIQEWKNVLLRGHDQGQREKYWTRFQQREQDVQDNIDRLLSGYSLDKKAQAMLRNFQELHRNMSSKYRDGYAAFEAANFSHTAGDAAVQGIDREPAKILTEAASVIRKQASQDIKDIANHASNIVTLVTILIILLSVSAAILVLFILRTKVITPVQILISSVDDLANKNYETKIDYQSKNELGVLAASVRKLQTSLKSAVSHMELAEQKIQSCFITLQNVNQTSKEEADKQQNISSSLERGMTELESTAAAVTECATETTAETKEAKEYSDICMQVFSKANQGFQKLQDSVVATNKKLEELTQQSEKIGSVTSVIQNIAEQTNLLSLNAAIEAARAGEQGRGFAVVADEVRSLAVKTQGSTEEIEKIISELRNMTAEATNSMRSGLELTEQNTVESKNAMESLEKVVANMTTLDRVSHKLDKASVEQRKISELMNKVTLDVIQSAEEYIEMSKSNTLSSSVTEAKEEIVFAVSELTHRK